MRALNPGLNPEASRALGDPSLDDTQLFDRQLAFQQVTRGKRQDCLLSLVFDMQMWHVMPHGVHIEHTNDQTEKHTDGWQGQAPG